MHSNSSVRWSWGLNIFEKTHRSLEKKHIHVSPCIIFWGQPTTSQNKQTAWPTGDTELRGAHAWAAHNLRWGLRLVWPGDLPSFFFQGSSNYPCCWWKRSGDHQLRLVAYPHYLQAFVHPKRWSLDFFDYGEDQTMRFVLVFWCIVWVGTRWAPYHL